MLVHSRARGAASAVVCALLCCPGLVQAADPPARAASAAAGRPALSVSVVQPVSTPLSVRLTAHGSIAPWQEASVGSEASGWRLAEVRVQVGDSVRKGQVLAVFASEMVQADLAQARAAVAEAEAALAEATANAQRARELQNTGALSAQAIQQYLTVERTTQARVESARAAARMQELRVRHSQVLSPDAGIISARSATVGAVVGAGQELFRLIRQGRLEWRAEVPSAELGRLKPGMSVTVQPPGGAPVAGRVRMVAPTVDPATRNGLVYVDLIGNGGARAGMFARGEFEISASAALTVPQAALVMRDGFSYVFLVGKDSRVVQQKVQTGRRQGDRVEIVEGLPAAASVVASGGGFLGDGDLVRVVAPLAAAPSPGAPASRPALLPVPAPGARR